MKYLSRHTPGPWKVSARLDEGYRVHGTAGMVDAICDVDEWNNEETTFANAHLIAKAPTYQELLKLAVQYLEHPDVQAIPFALPVNGVAQRITKALTNED